MPPLVDPPTLAISRLGTELLDDPRADDVMAAESLRNIARANRWFGGSAAVRWGLGRILAGVPRGTTFTLLDLGTGVGDLPLASVRWAARSGVRIVPIGLERSPVAASLARQAGVATILADLGRLPLRARSVDIVLLSQVAHHFDADSVVELLRLCDALARHGVLVCDLRRSPAAHAAFAMGAALLGFDPVTRSDGHTSIRRGFTVPGLSDLLAGAGVPARAVRRPSWRLVAAWQVRR
jgi:SAM-dependent methyltransferase